MVKGGCVGEGTDTDTTSSKPHMMSLEQPSERSSFREDPGLFIYARLLGGLQRIFMAKASFSAYVLGKNVLKTGEKVHFSTKNSTTNFGGPFCSFPFPCFASKWLYAVFAFQKRKKVGRNEASAIFMFGQLAAPKTLEVKGKS